METLIEQVPYEYKPEELTEIARQMGAAWLEINRLEGAKKQGLAELKSEIEKEQRTVKELGMKLACGYELRPVECIVMYDTPERGKKSHVSKVTGLAIRTMDMTEEELRQMRMDFEEP